MLNTISSTQYTHSIEQIEYRNREKRPSQTTGKRDTVSFSEEAYAALETYRQNMQTGNASATHMTGSAFDTPPIDIQDERAVEKEGKNLLDELKEYLKNPTMKHMMDKMEQAVSFMDMDEWTNKIVMQQIESAFRSGIPAPGDQTADVLQTLKKTLKDSTGMADVPLGKLMDKITEVLEEAQKEETEKNGNQQKTAGIAKF